jgi:tetratricopeptide (TPR) repeat protein
VQAVLRARVDRLEPDAREVLRLASIIGREFAGPVLERLFAAPDRLAEALEILVRQDLVQPVRVVPEPMWLFKHVLVQEVVYETLLLQQRRELHGRVGAVLEELHASRLEEHVDALAHHYQLSDRPDKAVEYLEKAGDKAARYFSLREARSYYGQAVELLGLADKDEAYARRFIDVAIKWAEASAYGASANNMAALNQALHRARAIGDSQIETTTLYWIARMHYSLGEMTRSYSILRECEDRLAHDPDSGLLARVRNVIGVVSLYFSEHELGIEAIQKAIPVFDRVGNLEQRAYGKGMVGLHLGLLGRFREAFAALDQAMAWSSDIRDKQRLAATNLYLALVNMLIGSFTTAIQNAEESIRTGLQIHIPAATALAMGVRGYLLFLTGDRETGIRETEEGIRLVRASGSTVTTSVTLGWLAEAHALTGNLQEGIAAADEYSKLYELGNRWGQIAVLRARGIAAATAGAEDWEEHFQQAIRLSGERSCRPELAVSHLRYAEMLAAKADSAGAKEQLGRAEALFQALDMTGWSRLASQMALR